MIPDNLVTTLEDISATLGRALRDTVVARGSDGAATLRLSHPELSDAALDALVGSITVSSLRAVLACAEAALPEGLEDVLTLLPSVESLRAQVLAAARKLDANA